ncbi:MAG: beta-glucosidase [Chitinophagaceae bacterium]|nr:beta-glucosidase [Chitinophagaceae bacterium]
MKIKILAFILSGSLWAISGCKSGKTAAAKKADAVVVADSVLFRLVQQQTFQYFRDGAEPVSGLARERIHTDNIYPQNDKSIVTSGGSGFGVMALLVGIERGFITKDDGRKQLEKIVHFLKTADRFHGAWPHWWNGETGKVKPFSKNDDGGDLVETSLMIQGLLCVRQYFNTGNEAERKLAASIDQLWKEVEFDWYRNGKNVLYWHWSPNNGWKMNLAIRGYNECLITYILAASSPTHSIPPEVYHEGWAENGKIKATSSYGGYTLQLHYQGNPPNGGPLFWAHYSYLGLDPGGLKDRYADYWEENKNLSLINYQWCVDNPKKFKGYGTNNWGLTSSYSTQFYFYDAFSEQDNWFPQKYLAIDQGPIVVMMENYRTGLLWNLFMSCPEIKQGLKKLGFESPHLKK